jgi:hypothetical protein
VAAVSKENGSESWGYINKNGEVAIEIKKELALPFSDGLAPVEPFMAMDEGWAYIDTSGTKVLDQEWEFAEPFHGPLARVALTKGGTGMGHRGGALNVSVGDARFAYINRSGEVVWKQDEPSDSE